MAQYRFDSADLVKQVRIIEKSFAEFFRETATFIRGDDPALYAQCDTDNAKHAELLASLEKPARRQNCTSPERQRKSSDADPPEQYKGGIIYTTLDHFEKQFQTIADLGNIAKRRVDIANVEKYLKFALTNKSTTYSSNIIGLCKAANIALDQFTVAQIDLASNVPKLFESLRAKENPEALTEIYDWAMVKRPPGIFMVAILKVLMRYVTPARAAKISAVVDGKKDEILNASILNLRTYRGVQGYIIRSQLRPNKPSAPAANIAENIGINYDAALSFADNLDAANIPAIYLDTATGSPAEFSLEILKSVKSPTAALTMAVIQQSTTVTILDTKCRIGQCVRITGQHNTTQQIMPTRIFESIDGGINIRELTAELAENHRQIARNDSAETTAKSAIDTRKGFVSGRLVAYANIQSGKIFEHGFRHKNANELLAEQFEKLSIPSFEPLQNSLKTALQEWQQKQRPITSQLQFIQYIDRDELTVIVRRVLAHPKTAFTKPSAGIDKDYEIEFSLTYLSAVYDLADNFTGELEKIWAANQLPSRVYAEMPASNIANQVNTIWQKAIDGTIASLESNNLWRSLSMTLKQYAIKMQA